MTPNIARTLAALELEIRRKADRRILIKGMSAAGRPQKITFAEMRESDVHGRLRSNFGNLFVPAASNA
jgi:hypothetical protein